MIIALAVSGRGLVDPGEPVVHADDEGFLRGRGAFETMRVYGSTPFRLAEHLDRLADSAGRLHLSLPRRAEIEELAVVALDAAGVPDAVLRVYVTPGRESRDEPVALVLVADLPPELDELRSAGIRMISVEFQPALLIGGVKSTSYALNMVAVDAARSAGADDAVFVGDGGVVLEATTSNIWWRGGGTLFTPALGLGVLAGVTRDVLLEVAPAVGHDVVEGTFSIEQLAGADEALTTSSVREVMPVVSLDGVPIGDGRPGEAARALQNALREVACR